MLGSLFARRRWTGVVLDAKRQACFSTRGQQSSERFLDSRRGPRIAVLASSTAARCQRHQIRAMSRDTCLPQRKARRAGCGELRIPRVAGNLSCTRAATASLPLLGGYGRHRNSPQRRKATMRSIKLTAAVAAAATVLAVAPAVAPAAPKHPHPQLSGEETAHASRCGLNIYAEPRSITVGETVEVFGQLNCGIRASATGRTITLYDHTPGGGNKAVATTTTVAAGFYSFVAPALTTNSTFFVRGAGVRSADRPVKVGPVVTLSGPTDGSQLFTGVRHEVTFTGTVSPADIGARVVLQRENATSSEEWHAIQFGYVLPAPGGPAAGGVYSLTHRFVSPGDANIRVIVRGLPPLIGRGTSNTLSYQISQAQNPKLTINSSNDAVSYGAPVTISGILAGGADKTVTLLARPRLVTGFTSIASAPTNEAGEYKFVIASAARNTFYQTTGEGISSAVLFQGVKYVLTAGVSATKATAGTAV